MAEQQKRGWVWGDQERLPEKLDGVERKADRVRIQMKRFAEAVPDFAAAAGEVGQAFIESAKPLVALWKARKNKYRPLSPEEATLALENVHRAEEAWDRFMRRKDVQSAVGEVNRGVRAQQRHFRSSVADARNEALARLELPEFRTQFREHVAKTLEQALLAADTAIALGFGGREHRELLRRLLLVSFVRNTYDDCEELAETLDAFIRRTPAGSMTDVALEAALNLFRHEISGFDPRRPKLGGPYDGIFACIHAAMESLMQSARKWADEGKTPEQIEAGYFTILRHDFSLIARP
ncbi:MAG: hypothetical protein WC538_00415 [Thermoanaerobaculia bacterium]|jgi:hypothetical protein